LLGYVIFKSFAWSYLKATEHFGIKHKCMFADIYNIVFQTQAANKPKTPYIG
jgi:hypothetical protein